MKKSLKNNTMMVIALFAMLSLGLANPALAGEKHEDPVVEIKYLGALKNQPVFQLILNNAEEKEYIITIKDEAGIELYSEKIKGTKVTRKYRIDTDEVNIVGVTFEVMNRKTANTVVYKVDATTRLFQDVTIAKL